MDDHGYDWGNAFPHDGEGGHMCTGYGCDCDEKNYGSFHRRSGGGGDGKKFWIAMIIAMIIGYGFNELVGSAIMIGIIWVMVWGK